MIVLLGCPYVAGVSVTVAYHDLGFLNNYFRVTGQILVFCLQSTNPPKHHVHSVHLTYSGY